ncbi:MAG: pyridoxamine 5'-phosphate oxidase family protein [Hyphomicrobiaceae bacterium]|nr:pyridoxamine 5'-phosphate oxidase family protein [Hyphomicrobiaceae bacterium]MCC0007626.1 pyridoxamine 5'-phosphate oxidase family protein [Hyphomicrobiaceae bacterium]
MGERHRITTLQELEMIYGAPRPQSLLKEVGQLTPEYRVWIEASPFVIMASAGEGGLDCTPRGDAGAVVHVLDDKTLLLPDRPGNNRIDTLRNLIQDPRVGLLFLSPGRDEAIRVNGRAVISVDPAHLQQGQMAGKLPRTALLISIDSVYFQCARAIRRSQLWAPRSSKELAALPSIGDMLQSVSQGAVDGANYDAELEQRINTSLY